LLKLIARWARVHVVVGARVDGDRRFNEVSNWVKVSLLNEKDFKKRCKLFEKFLEIAISVRDARERALVCDTHTCSLAS
jgi:hypothetical protein